MNASVSGQPACRHRVVCARQNRLPASAHSPQNGSGHSLCPSGVTASAVAAQRAGSGWPDRRHCHRWAGHRPWPPTPNRQPPTVQHAGEDRPTTAGPGSARNLAISGRPVLCQRM